MPRKKPNYALIQLILYLAMILLLFIAINKEFIIAMLPEEVQKKVIEFDSTKILFIH